MTADVKARGSAGWEASCIGSSELTAWLRDVQAGEIALIVDACQSAAAVDRDGFKPGPLGSRGLGQLAYDKGMRVLAACQKAGVALEDVSPDLLPGVTVGVSLAIIAVALAGAWWRFRRMDV